MAESNVLAERVTKRASISPCGLYRYSLERWWDTSCYARYYIMLNPSTADAEVDDPTIRRCMGLAKRDRFGGIVVLNLFAFRATSPVDMKAAADPVGPENDARIFSTIGGLTPTNVRDGTIVAAWGTHGSFRNRARTVLSRLQRDGIDVFCFGRTKDGSPKHPLYLSNDAQTTRLSRPTLEED